MFPNATETLAVIVFLVTYGVVAAGKFLSFGSMASTLAGNFLIVGSVANLIVVQLARRHNIEITFWEYFRVGAPLSALTIGIGILFLSRGG
jgi:Na+/H+ antiporter NhaD/arsenite permease-like protein